MSKSVTRAKRVFLAIAGVSLSPAFSSIASADNASWNLNAAGNWSVPGNWLLSGATVPDGAGQLADFSLLDITANRTVSIDTTPRTVGSLKFADITAEGAPATFKVYTLQATGGATLTLASSGTPTIDVIAGQSHTISAPIGGNQGFDKTGGGTVVFSGTNTITGPISVSQGTLRTNSATSFNNQTITVANGAQAYHNITSGTLGGQYLIRGDGVLEGDGLTALGAIRIATNGTTLSNTITLEGDAGISSRGTVTATPATLSGQITGNFALRLGRTSTTAGAGNNGFLVLSNTANNWGGDTTIEDGTVRLGASGVIPDGAGKGNVILHNAGTAQNVAIANSVLDLNGQTETINGLSHKAGTDVTRLRVNNSNAAAAHLIIGGNNAGGNYGGVIENGTGAGGVRITKTGSGLQTLSGTNTYTGETVIQGGALALSSSTVNNNVANSVRLVVGDTAANSAAQLDVTGVTTLGGFSVASGQTLAGHGTATGNIAVGANATVAPGNNNVGTLTRGGATDLDGTLKVDVDQSQAGVVDLLDNTSGVLDIGAGTIDFDVAGGLTQSSYVFAKYGTLVGTNFASVLDQPANYQIDYNYLGQNQIALVQVPEPTGAAALLSIAAVGLVRRRRRS